ncbi:hypothetical protein PFISCL1PPCAC_617 [Pristionchus fissidentatus]|uniref:B box-type domain-containing protein n=1 Tax=Pristionchus fissidentatus TaxID=1538716 RepID=A0AAV5UQ70_9BILA|nr:hypothetical protein PFISCL1PPCAC_617 [Pristionchus fissidentatus]
MLPLKDVAICTTAECAMMRKKICLSCAIRHHRKHDIVLLETVTTEIRGKCKEQLENLQQDLVAQIDKICALVDYADLARKKMREQLVRRSRMTDLINRSKELLNEKESAELLAIGQDLLKPFSDALSRWNAALNPVTEEMKELFDDDGEISVPLEIMDDTKFNKWLAANRRNMDERKRIMEENSIAETKTKKLIAETEKMIAEINALRHSSP